MATALRASTIPDRIERCLVFGDSHHALFKASPGIVAHHLGPVTMHRVGRDGISTFGFEQHDVRAGDALAFVFGEIDVRVHVAPQIARQGRPAQIILARLAARYSQTLCAVARQFPLSRVVMFSVPPPAGYDYPCFDPNHPRNGSDEQRASWARWLNRMLRHHAARTGMIFVDQYSMFVTPTGLLDLSVTHDGCHILPDFVDQVDLSPIFG